MKHEQTQQVVMNLGVFLFWLFVVTWGLLALVLWRVW